MGVVSINSAEPKTLCQQLAVKGKVLGRKVLGKVGILFTPDTILSWHQELVAKKWDYSNRKEKKKRRPRIRKVLGDVVVQPKIVGEFRGLIVRSEVRLTNKDRALACSLESARQSPRSILKAGPVPIRRAKRSLVVALRTNPLGDAVARRILASENGSGWRTDTHSVKVVLPRAAKRSMPGFRS